MLRNLLEQRRQVQPAGTTINDHHRRDARKEFACASSTQGAGIDQSEAARLFELYYRSPATAATASGAGIGLFVCRVLVEAMGGRIWACPRPEGGAEFGFVLQRSEDDED